MHFRGSCEWMRSHTSPSFDIQRQYLGKGKNRYPWGGDVRAFIYEKLPAIPTGRAGEGEDGTTWKCRARRVLRQRLQTGGPQDRSRLKMCFSFKHMFD